jgi:lipopolysaccharide biosynthesis glycosyltransferase
VATPAGNGRGAGPIAALRALVRLAPIASPAAPSAPAAPPAAPAPAAPRDDDLPQAVSLGYAGTEAALAALPEETRARLLRRAEHLMREAGPRRADAALIVAVARGMARDRVAAAEAAALFLTAIGDAASPELQEIESRLLAANNQLYQEKRGPEAGEVYRLLYARGRRDYLTVLRLLEAAVDRRDARAAAPYAEAFEAAFPNPTDPWGVTVLARFHTLAGDTARALALLAAVPCFPQTEAVAESVLLSAMIEAGGLDQAAERLRAHPANDSQELFNARFRIAVRQLDAEGVLALLEQERAARLPNWQLVEAMFLLSTPGKLSVHLQSRVTRRLYGAIEQRGFEDHGLVQARLHYLLMTQRWEDLTALFEALDVTPFATHRETLLRRLDFLCQTERIEAAQQLYDAHFRGTELNKWESLTILRLFSELKRWEEAAELLLGHVARGFDFGAAAHAAMRVVRRAGIHDAVLDVIAKSTAPQEPGLQEFVERVQEDLLIVQRANALALRPEAPGRGFRYRSNWILAPGEHAPDEHDEHCLLLCTNQRYFLSLLTFLCSFFGQAPQTGAQVFVFLDRDVPRRWHGTVAMVAARFGRSVTLITEAEFMTENVEHRVEYGFFAGGSNLSRSAYFRLYATRYLLERHGFRRALYVDTDIICRGDLTDLFSLPLGDNPISAATEDYSVEVVNASARNGLDPHKYFNSGVLLMQMDSPALLQGIEEAIRISEREPERLVFHDQCALNIAFQGRVATLQPRFNFFLRPSRDRNGHIEDGLLLHFLDKPKPWDITFDRSYREEWRVWALVLGTILPQNTYVDIFAAANRD